MSAFVIHRWCPRVDQGVLTRIGTSRDGKMIHLARPETVAAFEQMREAAGRQGVRLHVIWAFRDPILQAEQFAEARRKYGRRDGIKWLAPPGYSEHQTGWVLDIGDADDPQADDNPLFERTPAFGWLKENAARFSFELSFKPGNWQGVSYEPWHWRFVGTSDARRAFHPQGIRLFVVWGRSILNALRYI